MVFSDEYELKLNDVLSEIDEIIECNMYYVWEVPRNILKTFTSCKREINIKYVFLKLLRIKTHIYFKLFYILLYFFCH